VSVRIDDALYEENSCGDGQYDAFLNAIRKIYKQQSRELPQLIDYFVHIPPGSNSDALCETTITWKSQSREFITRGLDSDQTVSAIKATEKMLNQLYNA
jgi:D-citramalate synthase